jgi:hypothetical protein
MVIIEVLLLFIKGKRNKSQPYTVWLLFKSLNKTPLTIFPKLSTSSDFHKQDNNLALYPISHFIAIALADNVFLPYGIKST